MEIPESVRRLLWEYDPPRSSSSAEWERIVIERVMARGGWAEMRWLVRTFDRNALASYLRARGRRALAPRELRFWCTVSGVEAAEAGVWVQAARERERTWRG